MREHIINGRALWEIKEALCHDLASSGDIDGLFDLIYRLSARVEVYETELAKHKADLEDLLTKFKQMGS